MKISNQSLVVLLVAVLALVGIAVWLVLRPPPPPAAQQATIEEKIIESPPMVRRRTQSDFKPTGPVVVRAEEGRLIALECDGMRMERVITTGKATFESVPTTTGCSLNFVTPEAEDAFIAFEPILPGDDVMCRIDAKEIVCDGSLAELHAGTIMAWSPGEGEVKIDGKLIGPVPINNYRLPVGKHKFEFIGKRARSSWTLTVNPDEQIEIMFSSPARDATDVPAIPAADMPADTDAAAAPPDAPDAATGAGPPAPGGVAAPDPGASAVPGGSTEPETNLVVPE